MEYIDSQPVLGMLAMLERFLDLTEAHRQGLLEPHQRRGELCSSAQRRSAACCPAGLPVACTIVGSRGGMPAAATPPGGGTAAMRPMRRGLEPCCACTAPAGEQWNKQLKQPDNSSVGQVQTAPCHRGQRTLGSRLMGSTATSSRAGGARTTSGTLPGVLRPLGLLVCRLVTRCGHAQLHVRWQVILAT